MDRTAAGVGRLLEAVPERQQLRLAERAAEERQADRQVVAGEAGRDDEIGKAGEVGNVGRRESGGRYTAPAPVPAGGAAMRGGRRDAVGYTIASSCSAANMPSTTARIIGSA